MHSLKPWQQNVLALLRILTGALVIYHGLEVFDTGIMQGYLKWEVFQKMPAGRPMVYLGKILELLAGLSLLFGAFTRIGGVILALVMLFICFIVGHGKFWYEDQHPFVMAIIGLIFACTGPVAWSVDQWRARK
jgi:putative oxidoreductase